MKTFLFGLLGTVIGLFLLADVMAAISIGTTSGWTSGLLVGIPAYIALCFAAPFFLLFAVCLPLIGVEKIENMIKRAKKRQY